MNLLEILKIKKNNFEKIKSIAEQQEKLICGDLMQDYLVLSEERDLIKKEIDTDNKKHENLLKKADRKEKEMAMSINNEISEVIESILDVDKRIEQLVNRKKKEVLEDIKGLKKGQTAVKGYGNKKIQIQPRFIKRIG